MSLRKKSNLNNSQPTWPFFEQDEIDAVSDVLKSGKVNYWTGEQVKLFEKEFAAYSRVKHCIAVANGTLALELALYALDIQAGDEVIVPSATFIASASAVVMRGATPICADIEPYTLNISAKTIAPLITTKTKAIICVHLGGLPCEMDDIMALASEHNIYVIEDCAQAHGAEYKGQKIGSIGHMSAFSFCQDKIMTTGGEGGILLLNDEKLYQKAWSYKDHGKSFDKVFNTQHPPGFRWLHDSFGTNWRLTEMQGAIGRLQLQKLDKWQTIRQKNAHYYHDALKDHPAVISFLWEGDFKHAYYKYYFFLDLSKLNPNFDRTQFLDELNKKGCPIGSGSCCEIYNEGAFSSLPEVSRPTAHEMSQLTVMLQIDPSITMAQLEARVTFILNGLNKHL